jgi:diguanylate cyclase (GGDEF)-like protein
MWKTVLSGQTWHGEIVNRRKDGIVYDEALVIAPVTDADGTIRHFVAIMHDITERKQAEAQIHNLAFYDTLTRLPNRRLLNDRLGQTMAASKRNGRHAALMFLDLDNFKPLNDTHGHDVGDLLLIEVARRLTGCVRETDTVARFGGDEFVVILSELETDKADSATHAGIVAEKIRSALAEPYLLTRKQEDGTAMSVEHHCTSSIGIVIFINHEASPEEVLKCADMAMYQAKEGGRNAVRFYAAKG